MLLLPVLLLLHGHTTHLLGQVAEARQLWLWLGLPRWPEAATIQRCLLLGLLGLLVVLLLWRVVCA